MSLPIVLPQLEELWDCHQCGFCCRGSIIPLSPEDYARIEEQKWGESEELRGQRIVVRQSSAAAPYRLAQRSDGCCVFLQDDGLCRIHARFGAAAKPTVCQTFPLQLVPRDGQTLLTIRRACPSAARDLGSSVASHLPMIKQFVRDGRLKSESIAAPELKAGETRPWKIVRSVLDATQQLVCDERYPPVRRLVHALQFASLINQAKTRTLSDAQIVELSRTLAELAPEESKPLFAERQEPKSYAKVMFRLMAIDCARLHPESRHRKRWYSRLQLIDTAWRTLVGSGYTPVIEGAYARVAFKDLERPAGLLTPDVYQPLTRYLETNATNCLYALADRSGWSIIESIRGLALLFPVALWLLRWHAHGQPPTVDQMVNIIVSIDRSQGYAPLSGALHRGRLNTLSADAQLERLVIWYAQ